VCWLTAAVGSAPISLMRRLVILGLLMLAPSSAGAEYLNYEQWAALSPDLRAAYMTGTYDSLVGFVATPEEFRMARHYVDCLLRAQMSNTQLSENVREYAAPRPKFHGSTPQHALVSYLIELCGKPP
jgi:hypothetical protein